MMRVCRILFTNILVWASSDRQRGQSRGVDYGNSDTNNMLKMSQVIHGVRLSGVGSALPRMPPPLQRGSERNIRTGREGQWAQFDRRHAQMKCVMIVKNRDHGLFEDGNRGCRNKATKEGKWGMNRSYLPLCRVHADIAERKYGADIRSLTTEQAQ